MCSENCNGMTNPGSVPKVVVLVSLYYNGKIVVAALLVWVTVELVCIAAAAAALLRLARGCDAAAAANLAAGASICNGANSN